jgi:hypothetical protein
MAPPRWTAVEDGASSEGQLSGPREHIRPGDRALVQIGSACAGCAPRRRSPGSQQALKSASAQTAAAFSHPAPPAQAARFARGVPSCRDLGVASLAEFGHNREHRRDNLFVVFVDAPFGPILF